MPHELLYLSLSLKIIKDTPGTKMSKSARPGLPESLIPEPNQKAAAGPAAF
jgi:hypothetical protein